MAPHLPQGLGSAATAPDSGKPAALPSAVRDSYLNAVAGGTQTIFLIAAIVCAVVFLAGLLLEEVPLRGTGSTGKPTVDDKAPATSA